MSATGTTEDWTDLHEQLVARVAPWTGSGIVIERRDDKLWRYVSVRAEFSCRGGCVHGSSDCRPGSGGFHGIGCRILEFGVGVPGLGGVSHELLTGIYPPGVEIPFSWEPLGALDIHYAQRPDDWEMWDLPSDTECKLTGGECWLDWTMMQSETCARVLVEGGHEGVWSWLGEAWLPQAIKPSEAW